MSYFDNANTTVTRKSFGSKVDKTFQREGVVPVKNRKKEEKDVVAEAAKYDELNKKVSNHKLNSALEARKYEIQLQEGYDRLKDELMKDFLSEICVESLLIDDKVIDNNLKNIVSIVEEKVDEIGGFKGVKEIAESTQNHLLLNMVSVCEAVSKKVGERNIKQSEKCTDKLNFNLTKEELNEFDYRKQEMGTDTIVNTIKDKVFQVVQDEQKLNTERQEVMNEIETRVQELDAPVQEAMEFIFDENKIEEATLFDSLMRSHYKQILESDCSVIFESMDFQDEEEPVFEEQEFSMNDIELESCDNEKECDDDDDDDDYYEIDDDDDDCEDGECVEEAINQKKFQKKSRKMSDNKLRNKIVKWEKDIAATKARIKQETDEDYLKDLKEDLKILTNELKVFKNELAHRVKQAKVKTNPYAKESLSEIFESLYDNETVYTDNITEAMDKFVAEIQDDISDIKSKSEAVACKESIRNFQVDFENVLNEGLSFKMLDAKIANFFNNLLSKKLAKRDYSKVRENLKTMLNGNLTLEDVKLLEADLRVAKDQLTRAKQQHPQAAENIDEQLKWLNTEYKQMLADKKKEIIRKASMTESVNGLPTVESVFALMEARCNKKINESEDMKKIDVPVANEPKKGKNALEEADCGKKKSCEGSVEEGCNKKAKTCEACGKKMNEACGDKKTCEACSKKVKEEVILCPDCGKEKCICDEACKNKKSCKESFMYKLDECCEALNMIIEAHEIAYNNVLESLMFEIEDENVLVPYLQAKDCEMSNLEFAYKTKLVCETLKDSLKTIENNNDLAIMGKAIELNINSISEAIEVIKENEDLTYKTRMLKTGKQYLSKIQHIVENLEVPEADEVVTESTSIFNTTEDVEKIFNRVKEYYVIESTNNDMMELVMAEAIVDYTVLEAFNTLKLIKYDKDSVRQMSRKNLTK